ncbi:hypothetical protein Thein_1001 [Thermodesulfatator indicus DSM 15286]|uniref:DUF2905 domain-containing protein n=1 Tax=Thermodesulfatator indicus (strain DSM 15286 / JCM 11887 / CIR29812) TaxID=667014 RepID=F8ADJ9_THEID|nr:DUF2905 domain-containing protein [Thermodesulfatator indicus]AEH44873.1 hypothetical protein Thein_1001 [Thermodesulfatator indicus DSM 15286]
MNPFEDLGKIIILVGLFMVFVGGIMILGSKIPFLGKLPGDILIKRDNFTFYFPLGTCILLSILLTLIFSLIFRK